MLRAIVESLGERLRRGSNASLGEGSQSLGAGTSIPSSTVVRERVLLDARGGEIALGPDGFIGPHCVLRGPVSIGADALIAAASELSGRPDAPIVIEDDVWIGLRARVEAGVTIGRGAVIGAGAWVRDDVPAGAIVLGQPAQVRAQRRSAS